MDARLDIHCQAAEDSDPVRTSQQSCCHAVSDPANGLCHLALPCRSVACEICPQNRLPLFHRAGPSLQRKQAHQQTDQMTPQPVKLVAPNATTTRKTARASARTNAQSIFAHRAQRSHPAAIKGTRHHRQSTRTRSSRRVDAKERTEGNYSANCSRVSSECKRTGRWCRKYPTQSAQ